MAGFAWGVLTLVFVDELLAIAIAAVWGAEKGGWMLGMVLPMATVLAWALFASPKAPYGGGLVRPLVKAAVFVLASAALWDLDRPALAAAMLAFSVLTNALAQLSTVRASASGELRTP